VTAQEHHDVLDVALRRPRLGDALGAGRPDALHLVQPLWRAADDLERLDAEVLDQPLGQLRPDPGDHPGAEVALDAEQGLGRLRVIRRDAELAAEALVVLPRPARDQRRADRDAEQRPDHRDRWTAAGQLEPRDRPLVARILEDDPLERAFQDRALVVVLHMIRPPSTSMVRPLK
jgi:hypothetical protein